MSSFGCSFGIALDIESSVSLHFVAQSTSSFHCVRMRVLSLILLVATARGIPHEKPQGTSAGDIDGIFHETLESITKNLEESSKLLDRVWDNIEIDMKTPDVMEMEKMGSVPELKDQKMPPVEAIKGTVGGVDDGLKVYYEDSDGEPESVQIKPDEIPQLEPEVHTDIVRNSRPSAKPSSIQSFFHMLFKTDWWEGPNVCTDREEVHEPEVEGGKDFRNSFIQFSITTSGCEHKRNAYVCTETVTEKGVTRTITTTRRCCQGFTIDNNRCSRVELHDMAKTMESVNGRDFLALVKAAGIEKSLSERNLTIFVPTDEAMEEYTQDLEEMDEIENSIEKFRDFDPIQERKHAMTPAILSLMTDGFLFASNMTDEQVLKSLNTKSTLRINTYQGNPKIVTVNCARIVRANLHASNGVIHSIDRFLTPVTRSVQEILRADPSFSIFTQFLEKNGLMEVIEKATQQTIFAPTNEAFERLPNETFAALQNGNSCQAGYFMRYILANTICATAITDRSLVISILNQHIHLTRDKNGDIFVLETKVVERDIVATNGVIHAINGVFARNGYTLAQDLLGSRNLTRFLELFRKAEMLRELNSMEEVTVYAPSNEAIEKSNDIPEDPELLRKFLSNHITTSLIYSDNFSNNHIAQTQANLPLRLNDVVPVLFRALGEPPQSGLYAGCRRVTQVNLKGCRIIVHVIDDVITLPKKSVFEDLQSNKNLSIFTQMVKDLGMEKGMSKGGPLTILAPTNAAFEALPEAYIKGIQSKRRLMERLVRDHILHAHTCCSPFLHTIDSERKRTLDGSKIHLRMTEKGRLMAGPASITHCGDPTENGIVHTVNKVIHPITLPDSDLPDIQKTDGDVPLWLKLFGF